MVNVKRIKINKSVDENQPFSYVFILGMQIVRFVKKGYNKFEIYDKGDYIEVKTWRIRKGEE